MGIPRPRNLCAAPLFGRIQRFHAAMAGLLRQGLFQISNRETTQNFLLLLDPIRLSGHGGLDIDMFRELICG